MKTILQASRPPIAASPGGKRAYTLLRVAFLSVFVSCVVPGRLETARAQEVSDGDSRDGYVVFVDLPLVGQRDEQVRRQIKRIADSSNSPARRPIVVLQFRASPLSEASRGDLADAMGTRGSQFERCLALARYLTSSEVARIRLIAYLPETVEGHAVLPILACEEIVAESTAELGRATIDEPLDATIQSSYRDVVARRATLPEAVVLAMLDRNAEVYDMALGDGTTEVASREQRDALREQGRVLSEETIWPGGALATFSGQQMRSRRWIVGTAADAGELASVLHLSTTLRTSRQLPRDWKSVSVTIAGALTMGRVNQLIRAVNQQRDGGNANLLIVRVEPTDCDFQQAARLASFLAGQDSDRLYTLGIVVGDVRGPAGLIVAACDDTVLLTSSSIGPRVEQATGLASDEAVQRVLNDLSLSTDRPLPLLSALVDSEIEVHEYIQQETGKRSIFTRGQIAKQADANLWLEKQRIAGGEAIEPGVALRYRLIDAVDDSESIALGRLGVEQVPSPLKTPWLDATIQMLLAQSWLPRLLLTIGFFALMAELGNPGISVGGFLAGVCFIGFFWIEGLNGNVESLEILLFLGGLVALSIELFVIPGFGVFGIGGLLMLLVSVVLASQTFIWPTTSAQLSEVSVNLFWVACLALGGMIGLLFMHRHLEQSPLLRWVTLQPADEDDSEALGIRESLAHHGHLLGQEGLTTTRLNPSGKAQFGRDIVGVVGTGKMISEGVAVRVVEVRGPLILVEELDR